MRLKAFVLLCLLMVALMVPGLTEAQSARDLSGLWFDPAHNGEGFVVEVVSEELAVVYWFTYDGGGKQRWFIGLADITGDELDVSELLMPVGARFGPDFDPSDVEQAVVGSLALSFTPDSATAQYTVDAVDGVQNLVRLAVPRSVAAVPGLADCVTGSWYDPGHDGEGYILHLLDDQRAVIMWFSYTPDGQQAWFISDPATIEGDGITASMLSTAGGRFGPDFDPDEVVLSEWGELELALGSCTQGRSDYASLLPEFGSGALENLVKLTALLRPTGLADDPVVRANLQQILDSQYAQQGNTGMSVGVVFGDGSAWTGSAGWDDPRVGKALTPEQTLGFASITKTYVAALIMQLFDEGAITLDDTIADWLPPQNNISASARISHLLNHQSGIADYVNDSNILGALRANPGRSWTPEEIIASYVKPAYYSPAVSSGYSNTNYLLLGQILKVATGEEVSTLLRQRIFDRNGLDGSYLGGEEPSADNIPVTWVDLTGNGVLDDFSALYDSPSHHSGRWTVGGVFSTVEDVARWAHVLVKGNVVSPETAQRMRQFVAINGTGAVWTGYGLGVQQYFVNGLELWGHSGGMSGSGSLMVYSPQLDVSIALIDNDRGANHFNTIRAILPYLESVL